MLDIRCEEYLAEVKQWAAQNACLPALEQKLDRLTNYGDDGYGKFITYLHQDFSPHSFAFTVKKDGNRYLTGGLIYSGPSQPLDGSGPAFTVGIGTDSTKHGWSIHT